MALAAAGLVATEFIRHLPLRRHQRGATFPLEGRISFHSSPARGRWQRAALTEGEVSDEPGRSHPHPQADHRTGDPTFGNVASSAFGILPNSARSAGPNAHFHSTNR